MYTVLIIANTKKLASHAISIADYSSTILQCCHHVDPCVNNAKLDNEAVAFKQDLVTGTTISGSDTLIAAIILRALSDTFYLSTVSDDYGSATCA